MFINVSSGPNVVHVNGLFLLAYPENNAEIPDTKAIVAFPVACHWLYTRFQRILSKFLEGFFDAFFLIRRKTF